jgi:hypothetical protein
MHPEFDAFDVRNMMMGEGRHLRNSSMSHHRHHHRRMANQWHWPTKGMTGIKSSRKAFFVGSSFLEDAEREMKMRRIEL